MTKDDILLKMNGCSVTNGWDVVCAMSADRLTQLFQDKYDMEKDQPCPPSGVRASGLPCRIKLSYLSAGNQIDVDVNVGPPLISFIEDDPTRCKCQFLITSGTFTSQNAHKARGTVTVSAGAPDKVVGTDTVFTLQAFEGDYMQIGTDVAVIKTIVDDENIILETPMAAAHTNEAYSLLNGYQVIPSGPDDQNSYYIISIIPLVMIEGSVTLGNDVVIDFNNDGGSYTTDLVLDPAFSNGLSDALKTYFKTTLQSQDYSLGTLIYSQNPELIMLTPSAFHFATGVRSGDKTDTGCLMLFIALTGSSLGSNTYLTGNGGQIDNPIPDGQSAALIISSKVFFDGILLPQYKSGFNNSVFSYNEGPLKTWMLKCTGSIDGGRINSIQEQDVSVPCDDFQVYSEENAIKVSWNESWDQIVQYKASHYSDGYAYESTDDGTINVTISVDNPTYTFSVSEPDEVLNCNSNPSIDVDIPHSQMDSYGMDDAENDIKKTLNNRIKGILKINLKGVSIFAVSNLLFPMDHIITYDANGVYAPGDLIIFGTTKEKLQS